ncbi:translocator protein 2 isoform X3 [Cynocephalus volans]|uniref:translocator protein 2 isoform X3 n=1 Tax=Cynocephalus volans TaxID=110931 RepID=UPI002FC92BE2
MLSEILPPQGECGPHGAIFMVLPHLGLILVWLFTHKQMSGWCEGPRSLPWCPLHKVLLLIRTTIYSVMGYASYLVWKDLGKGFGRPLALPLGLYAAQLVISWIIPILFFRAHSPGLECLPLGLPPQILNKASWKPQTPCRRGLHLLRGGITMRSS